MVIANDVEIEPGRFIGQTGILPRLCQPKMEPALKARVRDYSNLYMTRYPVGNGSTLSIGSTLATAAETRLRAE